MGSPKAVDSAPNDEPQPGYGKNGEDKSSAAAQLAMNILAVNLSVEKPLNSISGEVYLYDMLKNAKDENAHPKKRLQRGSKKQGKETKRGKPYTKVNSKPNGHRKKDWRIKNNHGVNQKYGHRRLQLHEMQLPRLHATSLPENSHVPAFFPSGKSLYSGSDASKVSGSCFDDDEERRPSSTLDVPFKEKFPRRMSPTPAKKRQRQSSPKANHNTYSPNLRMIFSESGEQEISFVINNQRPLFPLQSGIERLKRESDKLRSNLFINLEREKMAMPLPFLMKYKLNTYCFEKGSKKIIEVMTKVFTRTQRAAIQQWRQFIYWRRRIAKQQASICIQKIARGVLCRKRKVLFQRRSERARAEKASIRELAKLLDLKMDKSKIIQRVWRGHFHRNMVKSKRAEIRSVLRVQTQWRGRRCRFAIIVLKELQARKERSAIRIQAAYRGMKGRRTARARAFEVLAKKRELLLTNAEYLRSQRFYQTGASVVIQRAFRKYLFRQNFTFLGHRILTQIQRIIRGFLGRCRAKKRREIKRYQQWVKSNQLIMDASASKIQRMFRARQSRYLLARLKNERLTARAMRLEAKAIKMSAKRPRGRFGKLFVSKKTKAQAAVSIQRFWRGKLARRHMVHHRRKVIKTRKQRAATYIQRCFRGSLCRAQFKAMRIQSAAIKIQKVVRGYQVREVKRKTAQHLHKLIKLQSWFRSCLARKNLSSMKTLHRAAKLIQSHIRGYQTYHWMQTRLLPLKRELDEKDVLGASQLRIALDNESDRLLLAAFYCDPKVTPSEKSEPLELFRSLGQSKQTKDGSSLSTPKKHEKKKQCSHVQVSIGTAAFTRFFRDVGIIQDLKDKDTASKKGKTEQNKDSLPGSLSSTQTDIIFSKCCMGKKKMDYLGFTDALELTAQELYADISQLRMLKGVDAQIVSLLQAVIITGSLRDALESRVQTKANQMAGRIEGMFRMWKSRQRARMARIAQNYKILIDRQTKACEVLQRQWRGHKARRALFASIRSSYKCFVDIESKAKFWLNPVSQATTWIKPAILGNDEVDAVISIPPERHQLVEYCSRCEQATISYHCEECAESFCQNCTSVLHKKGNRAKHDLVQIPRCSTCVFQLASRICVECGDLYLCDTCADYTHRAGSKLHHAIEWLLDDLDTCELCGTRAARYDCPGPTCSFCAEKVLFLDLLSQYPRKYVTSKMRSHWADLQEHRMKQFLLDQAQEKEEMRKEKEKQKAAVIIQKICRGFIIRRSDVGRTLQNRIRDRQERLDRMRQEAENKKVINRLKNNLSQIQNVKAFTADVKAKLLKGTNAREKLPWSGDAGSESAVPNLTMEEHRTVPVPLEHDNSSGRLLAKEICDKNGTVAKGGIKKFAGGLLKFRKNRKKEPEIKTLSNGETSIARSPSEEGANSGGTVKCDEGKPVDEVSFTENNLSVETAHLSLRLPLPVDKREIVAVDKEVPADEVEHATIHPGLLANQGEHVAVDAGVETSIHQNEPDTIPNQDGGENPMQVDGEDIDDWLEYFDEANQATYYYNPKRRESRWDNPVSPVSPPETDMELDKVSSGFSNEFDTSPLYHETLQPHHSDQATLAGYETYSETNWHKTYEEPYGFHDETFNFQNTERGLYEEYGFEHVGFVPPSGIEEHYGYQGNEDTHQIEFDHNEQDQHWGTSDWRFHGQEQNQNEGFVHDQNEWYDQNPVESYAVDSNSAPRNDWIEYIDESTGAPYYFNTITNITQWENPFS